MSRPGPEIRYRCVYCHSDFPASWWRRTKGVCSACKRAQPELARPEPAP